MTILTLIERKPLFSFLTLLSFMLLVIFKDYIFLDKLYLFSGAAGDSIAYSYPHFIHDSEYLRNNGIPKWSFNIGMGQNIFPISVTDPFSLILISFSKDALPHAIAYIELIKIFFIGLFSFLYLKELKLTPFATIGGGLLFSFSSYALLHGGWYHVFSANAVYVMFLLFAFEKLFKQGIWYWFPLSIALIACLSPFYLLLDCELLLLYSILRYSEERKWNPKEIFQFVSQLSLLGLVGILISAVCLFSGLQLLLENPRVFGNLAQSENITSNPVFQPENINDFRMACLRMFSTDIFGAGVHSPFKDDPKYLEGNIGYCGLITLLLLAQIFYLIHKKKKIIYGCILSFFILGFIFPYFRHMFWLFSGNYYRLFSYFFAIILLYYSIQAFSKIEKQLQVNKIILIITLIILLITLHYKYSDPGQVIIDKGLQKIITYLLCLYAVLLHMMTSKKWQRHVKIILLLTIVSELIYFSRLTISERTSFTFKTLTQKTGYNDYTNNAMAYIHSFDKSFFRVGKDYFSGYGSDSDLNTPQCQGYMSTTSYSSFNQPSYLAFLYTMRIDTNLYTATRSQGLNNNLMLQTWASVKYHLIKHPESIPIIKSMGYNFIYQVNDIKIFKNMFSLPLGYTYKKYITKEEFDKANILQKNKILLNSFIIDKSDMEKYSEFHPLTTSAFIPNGIVPDEYTKPIEELKSDTLVMAGFTQNTIDGDIKLNEKKLLFFSIPFDKGWKVIVNGQEKTLEKVNIGFIGLLLDKGVHKIHLEFEPPFVKIGLIISLIGIGLYAYLLRRFRNKRFTT